jgi:hypothetical protein
VGPGHKEPFVHHLLPEGRQRIFLDQRERISGGWVVQ